MTSTARALSSDLSAARFDVFTNKFAFDIFKDKYAFTPEETWGELAARVVENVCQNHLPRETKDALIKLIVERKFIPAGRYLYAAGRAYHQYNNCFLWRAEDSREGWADLSHKNIMCLMSGGGVGTDYSGVRPANRIVGRTGGVASGPISLASLINEDGRQIMNGGNRRAAVWAGLAWWHPDIWAQKEPNMPIKHEGFIYCKNWSQALRDAKAADLTFPLPMELTNISVIYDTAFFTLIQGGPGGAVIIDAPWGEKLVRTYEDAMRVWMANCRQAFKTAEPGMSFNYLKDKESLRNACCEVVSEDDSDKCNLGTLWLNRFDNIGEFKAAIRLAVQFLLCGGITSDLPIDKVRAVGKANNRIGLGLGGFHEWLMVRGYGYEVVPELHEWLVAYRDISDEEALTASQHLGVAFPKGRRAIAPNGTIGIVAETTTGIEPLFCAAFKRRYFKDGIWHYQYVVDGMVKRLIDRGVSLSQIKDAYDISFEQRIKFQADVQEYVDMSISSTCNMPEWGTEANNSSNVEEKANILLKYAHRLRGFTCYPDKSRGGQPLEKVDLEFALSREGQIFEEKVRECTNGVCGL